MLVLTYFHSSHMQLEIPIQRKKQPQPILSPKLLALPGFFGFRGLQGMQNPNPDLK